MPKRTGNRVISISFQLIRMCCCCLLRRKFEKRIPLESTWEPLSSTLLKLSFNGKCANLEVVSASCIYIHRTTPAVLNVYKYTFCRHCIYAKTFFLSISSCYTIFLLLSNLGKSSFYIFQSTTATWTLFICFVNKVFPHNPFVWKLMQITSFNYFTVGRLAQLTHSMDPLLWSSKREWL